jgi:hypothetical protein
MSSIAIKNSNIYKNAKIRSKADSVSEENEIINELTKLKNDIEILYNQFNFLTEPQLIDSCIYDLQAANARYGFYLRRCKEKKISAASMYMR